MSPEWVVALATVLLVVLTAFYTQDSRRLLGVTRREVNRALGRDAKSMEEKRRRVLLIGRRIDSVLMTLAQSDSPSDEPLWTDAEIRQLETLLPDFGEVHLNDASSVIWTLTQIRHHLIKPAGVIPVYGEGKGRLRMDGMDFRDTVTDTRNKLLGILDTIEGELNRTSSRAV